MFSRRMGAKRRVGAVPVHLNVYDLTPINGYAYWLGLGVYHSGVQGTDSWENPFSCSFVTEKSSNFTDTPMEFFIINLNNVKS